MLKSFSTVSTSFEIDEPSAGIWLLNIPKDATIKINRLDKQGDVNIFPELSIEACVNLFSQLSETYPFYKLSSGNYDVAKIPFSTMGILDFNDDTRYEVTIDGNTDTNEVEIYNHDSGVGGNPIKIQRLKIDGDLTEKTIDVSETEFLFFPNGLPEKVEYFVFKSLDENRKVTISKKQMQLGLGVNQIVGKNGTAYEYDTSLKTMSVRGLSKVTLHLLGEGTDFVCYKIDSSID